MTVHEVQVDVPDVQGLEARFKALAHAVVIRLT